MQDGFSTFSAWVDSTSHFDPVVEQILQKEVSTSIGPESQAVSVASSLQEAEASGVGDGTVTEAPIRNPTPSTSSSNTRASIDTSGRHRQRSAAQRHSAVRASPVAFHPHQVQRGVDVLINHYLNMLPPPELAKFDEPKGLGKLFVSLLCKPSDVAAWLQPFFALVTLLAHLIMATCFIWVPTWLWAVRHAAQQNSQLAMLHAAILAVCGLLVLLAADALHSSNLKQQVARTQGVITTAHLGAFALPPPQLALPVKAAAPAAPAPSSAPAAPVSASSGTTVTTAVTAADAAAAAAPRSGTAAAHGPPSSSTMHRNRSATADDVQAHKVRTLIIELERTVYGNELTEGVLPAHVLPQRVQKLCEEVGLAWENGGSTSLSLERLLEILGQVQRELGL